MQNVFVWGLLVLFAMLLIVAGIQGSAGRLLAVALVPAKLDVTTGGGQTSAQCPPGMLRDPMTGQCVSLGSVLV